MAVNWQIEKWKSAERNDGRNRRIWGNCLQNRSIPDFEPADRDAVVPLTQRTSESGAVRLKRTFGIELERAARTSATPGLQDTTRGVHIA